MRIEINAGGLGAGLAVAEYQLNMAGFLSDAESVISSFKTVRAETYDLPGGVGSLQGAVDELSARIYRDEDTLEAAQRVQQKSEDFFDLAIRVDKSVATLVDRNKDEFYRVNPWLKPATDVEEESWGEQAWGWLCGLGEAVSEAVVEGVKEAWSWIKDSAKKAWNGLVEFYNEHKKVIDTILLIVGAVAAIAAVIASGGGALIPLLTALGCSAGTAAAISGAVAVVAVVSTVASTTMNVIDVWAEIDDPTFQAVKKGLNFVSGVSNFAYSIGGFYNSLKGITPEQAKNAMKAATSGRAEFVTLDDGSEFLVSVASDFQKGADAGINRYALTNRDPGVFYSVQNQNGGQVFVSVNPTQGSGMDVVQLANQVDGPVNVISGTHGNVLGGLAQETDFFYTDCANFANNPNVTVYDIFSLGPQGLQTVVNSPGTTICAWCYSERSVDVLQALGFWLR